MTSQFPLQSATVQAAPGMGLVRVHRLVPLTDVEGPGKRACLWVQQCPLACEGCFNRATWDFASGSLWSIAKVFASLTQYSEIEGVTFTGGEPFAQAAPLAALGAMCRDIGLSVVTFSGYEYISLKSANRSDWDALLRVTDLLLSGPFVQAKRDFSRPWVGSKNQEFIFITDRYRDLEPILRMIPNRIEMTADERGRILINGMASPVELAAMSAELASIGLQLN